MEIPYIVKPRKDTGLNNSKIAIWLFLASEVMLFGGLFSAYIFLRYFADYPWPERALPVLPGLINTFILIASSVTVVFAWAALKMGKWRLFVVNMSFTLLCAVVFMFFKFYEYKAKLTHQSVKTNDYAQIEGHLDGHDKKQKGYKLNYALTPRKSLGDSQTSVFGYNIALNRYHQAYIDKITSQLTDGKKFTLVEDYKATQIEDSRATEITLMPKGSEMNAENLSKMKEYFIKARSANEKLNADIIREAWKLTRQNPEVKDLPNWNDKKKAVKSEHVQELKKQYANNFYIQNSETLFTVEANQEIYVPSGWKKKVETLEVGQPTSVVLLDGSSILGTMADSSIVIDVDAIDFRHLVMRAEEYGKDPEVAIANSYVLNVKSAGGDRIRKIWACHQEKVRTLTEYLKKKEKNPTKVDKYRITWKQLVAFKKLGYDPSKCDWETVKENEPSMFEGLTGPNHKNFNPVDDHHHVIAEQSNFPRLVIPRDEVKFESVFSPKKNNYYAIYFTVTGLHGLHVIGGALVLGYYLFFGYGMFKENPEWLANRVEVAGLFWHFVDLVWIFAFPIFYLM